MAQHTTEILTDREPEPSGGELRPFFDSAEEARAIRKKQPVWEQQKWADYFDEHGCLICERKDARHAACGMCRACYLRTRQRLQAVMRKRAPGAQTTTPRPRRERAAVPVHVKREGFIDDEKLARAALMPSIEALRGEPKQLSEHDDN